LHRIPEALAVLHEALVAASSAREWGKYRELLWQAADVERFHSATATARAYASEVLLISDDSCNYRRFAELTLAGAALLDVDGRGARRHLEAAGCGPPALGAVMMLAD